MVVRLAAIAHVLTSLDSLGEWTGEMEKLVLHPYGGGSERWQCPRQGTATVPWGVREAVASW